MEVAPLRNTPAYTTEWQEWLAENLLRGVEVEKIVAAMTEKGFATTDARRCVTAQQGTPSFRVALRLLSEHRKLHSLVDALSDQWNQSPGATSVPVMDPPDEKVFFENFYFANRPVLIRGLASEWPASNKWSPDYFTAAFGDSAIEITGDRDTDPRFEEKFAAHRRELTMREFAARAMEETSNDLYIVAKNKLLQRKEFQQLLDDIRCPRGFLNPAALSHAKLWFGPAGTLTPLHHDDSNILFVQIYGSKLVRLVEPHNLPRLYNNRECYSPVDLDDVNLKRFPLMKAVPVAEVTVHRGDALFLPLGWWHWVKSLEPSISLSFVGGFDLPGCATIWRHS